MREAPLKRSPEVLARTLPGGAVLVHLPSNTIFELNETSAKVWELLGDGLDKEQILHCLIEEFDVDPLLAAAELQAVLEHFVRERLLNT